MVEILKVTDKVNDKLRNPAILRSTPSFLSLVLYFILCLQFFPLGLWTWQFLSSMWHCNISCAQTSYDTEKRAVDSNQTKQLRGQMSGRSILKRHWISLGSRDGAVVRALASHQSSRVRFPDPASYVDWVCCWFSSLLREVFLRVLRFSPLPKNQHFQFPIRSWNARTFLNEFLWTPWCFVGKQITNYNYKTVFSRETDNPTQTEGPIHETLEKFENVFISTVMSLSTLIRHENGAFQTRSSNRIK